MDVLQLPDENDRHVLAAAIAGRADVIVTYNLGDFPAEVLSGFGIEAQHPDVFLSHLLSVAQPEVSAVVKRLRAGLTRPSLGVDEYLDHLERIGLIRFVAELRPFSELL